MKLEKMGINPGIIEKRQLKYKWGAWRGTNPKNEEREYVAKFCDESEEYQLTISFDELFEIFKQYVFFKKRPSIKF